MEVAKVDLSAIDTIILASRKAHYFNIEGDDCINLAQSISRLLNLKARIQKELSDTAAPIQVADQPAGMVVSPPRPITQIAGDAPLEQKKEDGLVPEKEVVNS
jgi:hypothetical protein